MKIVVVGQFRMPVENLDAARPMMRAVIEATRAEEGCVQYNYAEDAIDPELIRVSEIWESREQLFAHLKSPHMAVWGKQRTALGLSEREIFVFEASNHEAL